MKRNYVTIAICAIVAQILANVLMRWGYVEIIYCQSKIVGAYNERRDYGRGNESRAKRGYRYAQ
jgi:hypothetical protein